MVGYILLMCKGLGIIVKRKLYVHTHIETESVDNNGIPMIGFKGDLKVNIRIPDFFGLGKVVSQVFGTIKQIKNIENNQKIRCAPF
jgi:hypothetical protein